MAPTPEVPAAPFIAQTGGAYSAGNPQEVTEPASTEVIKAAPTVVYQDKGDKWEPPVGRYHPRENDFAETSSPPKPGATAQQEVAKAPVAAPASQDVPQHVSPPGTDVDGDDSVSAAPVATPQSSGNPYWKIRNCNILDLYVFEYISESFKVRTRAQTF